jgi:hypothetical protein
VRLPPEKTVRSTRMLLPAPSPRRRRSGLWLRLLAIACGVCPFECAAPTYTDCLVACGSNGSCPNGLSCSNGHCTAGGACIRSAGEPDAAAGGGSGTREAGLPNAAGGEATRDASSVDERPQGSGGRVEAGSGGTRGTGGAGSGGAEPPDSGRRGPPPDAMPDGSRSDASDASLDTPPPKCDLSKPFGAREPLRGALESTGLDASLALSANGLEAYFESTRGDGLSRIWRATRSTTQEDFTAPEALWPARAAPQNDAFLTPDGKTLFYRFDADIYAATRDSPTGPFGDGSPVTALNSDAMDADPFITSDGQAIYFDTARNGKFDIYKATWAGNGFENPVPVTSLNTDADEYAPVLSKDGKTIYFGATRSTIGSLRIWKAHRATPAGDFGPATYVEELAPVPAALEFPDVVADEGCTLYFTVGQPTTYHLYRATKPP